MNKLDLKFSDEFKEKHKQVLSLYSEPHRKYHTLDHLTTMFYGLSEMHDWLVFENYTQKEIDAIKDLIVYHDAVYTVGSISNEESSAALMVSDLALNQSDAFNMTAAILSTGLPRMHNTDHLVDLPEAYRLARVLCDVDLYVFALDPSEYDTQADLVLNEYMGDKGLTFEFYIANVEFLLSYLKKLRLFNTTFAQAKWEKRARVNILNRIGKMSNDLSATSCFLGRLSHICFNR